MLFRSIRTFVYGFSVTSRYIQLLVQPDFINSILALLLDEDTTIKFDEEKFVNKPALTIYSDMTKHAYVNVKELVERIPDSSDTSVTEEERVKIRKEVVEIMTASHYRFNVTEYTGAGASKRGTYFKAEDGSFELIAVMSASQKSDYDKLVEKGEKSYYDVNSAPVYIRIIDTDASGNVINSFVLYSTDRKSVV